MNCKRFFRVLPVFALTASLGYAAFLAAAEPSILIGGQKIALSDADGGWPSHAVVDPDKSPSTIHHKHIGHPKYEDIKASMRVGQFDPIMLDLANTALSGKLKRTSFAILFDRNKKEVARYNFFECWPTKIVTPSFDSEAGECTDWQISFSIGNGNGYPALMKAKEKGSRTKCANNLRLIVNDNGKPRAFDVSSSEPVQTILLEADLDGDGEFESLDVQVGNVVVYLPAVQSGYFQEWMRMSGENPLYEGNKKDATLRVQTDRFGTMEFAYGQMQPISVAQMGDGSVRVEFCTAEEQLKANPRH